ncbi:EAL domain-containing protein [Shewanella sp. AS1]|uniref:EAL domain-containing protein n=1 Tax=Shewanella sp. AS1 TaxID=2907626 RepID=UPI001F1E1DE6|nr:EAL domain-containing protein [Shewanella sp. AS1]MCE9678550.1 EAL domain-containing protein [Shewanella sp. AS1]
MPSKFHLQDIEAKYLKIVSEFAIDMLSLQGVDNILWHLAQNVVAQMGFDDVVVYLLDQQRGMLIQRASYGAKNPKGFEILSPIELKLGEGVVGEAAKRKQPLRIPDTRLYPNYIVDDAPRLSELAVPMLIDGEVVGVIDTEHPKKNFYNEQHERTLFALASITAMKIHKAKSVVKLQQTIEELEYSCKIQDVLFEIAELIFETHDLPTFYHRLHLCISRLIFAKNFYIALLDNTGQRLCFPYHVDEFDEIAHNTYYTIDPHFLSVTGYVLLKNQPLLADKAELKRMVAAGQVQVLGELPRSWLGIPFGHEHFKGIVVVQSYDDNYLFQTKDKQLLIFAAKHICNAIERMNLKSRSEEIALHHPLTGLANRPLLFDRIAQACNRVKSTLKQQAIDDNLSGISLLYLDIDHFKLINDTYGHHLGDELLKAVAVRLGLGLGQLESVCHLRQDQFAILLDNMAEPKLSLEVANRLLDLFEQPINLSGIAVKTSVSIGIANCGAIDISPNGLLMLADEAMQKAKQLGGNRVYVHDGAPDELLLASFSDDFNQAIAGREFYLEFQPIYQLKSDRVIGAEALVRWQHPKLGPLMPMQFIAACERNGALQQLDCYVVETVSELLSEYQSALPKAFRLNVNLSGSGLNSTKLLSLLESKYCNNQPLLSLMGIEVKEQVLSALQDEVKQTLSRQQNLGLSIALDDFGTSCSSLKSLHQMNFNLIKIDRAFVRYMDMAIDNQITLETIIKLAKTLNIQTVAEGIETHEQYQRMQNFGCDYGQGYFMHGALNWAQLLEVIEKQESFSRFG